MEGSSYISRIVSFSNFTENDIREVIQGGTLLGRNGLPARLYTSEGKPVTNVDGVPLKNITGQTLMRFNKITCKWEDLSGLPLRDSWGRLPDNPHLQPEKDVIAGTIIDPILDRTGHPRVIFDWFGQPLTDSLGRPLMNSLGKCLISFDSTGEPGCDIDGNQIIYCSDITQSNNNNPLCNSLGQPLRIYDVFKRPLTTADGVPLLDIVGAPLVHTDPQNNPINTIYGSEIYDSRGLAHTHPKFDPTIRSSYWRSLPPYQGRTGSILLIFDQTGFPLTEPTGIPLMDIEGNPLLKYDRHTGLISYAGHDVIKISRNLYNPNIIKSICNDAGKPARLFNFQGKPLTNWLGEPLKHADGTILLKFGHDGSPVNDFQGLPFYDEYGVSMIENDFMPFDTFPLNSGVSREIDAMQNGIKLFDESGMPLTDYRGFYLCNAKRKIMIQRNSKNIPVSDSQGGPIFIQCGLPLLQSCENPIIGPRGKICRLFDRKGYPLTCRRGIPLKSVNGEFAIKVDKIGRIIGNSSDGLVYDSKGNPMTFSMEFNPTKFPKMIDQSYLRNYSLLQNNKQLYNMNGYPLTDVNGELLSDCDGNALIEIDLERGYVTDTFGHPVYELGGSIYQMNVNKLLTKEIYFRRKTKENDFEREPKIEKLNNCCDIKNNAHIVNCKAGTNSKILNGHSQLFECESIPNFDSSGSALETYSGSVIELEECLNIVSDLRGFDVFDVNGLPLTKITGFWKNQRGEPLRLFHRNNMPLTDSKGRSLYNVKGQCLLATDDIGRPIVDNSMNPVYDWWGVTSSDPKFCPWKQPPFGSKLLPVTDLNDKPLRIYNSKGWPLNDEDGIPLLTNRGIRLIIFNLGLEVITDTEGKTVYDENEIPFGCKQDSSIETMSGMPFRLFNAIGQPLTDSSGMPLKFACELCLVVFDMYGRPFQDSEGEGLFDASGNVLGSENFQPDNCPPGLSICIQKTDGSPIRIYDQDGRPLTDRFGMTLISAFGECVVVDEMGLPRCTADGGDIYNEYGIMFEPENENIRLKYQPTKINK